VPGALLYWARPASLYRRFVMDTRERFQKAMAALRETSARSFDQTKQAVVDALGPDEATLFLDAPLVDVLKSITMADMIRLVCDQ
jgi:hypothetical protein